MLGLPGAAGRHVPPGTRRCGVIIICFDLTIHLHQPRPECGTLTPFAEIVFFAGISKPIEISSHPRKNGRIQYRFKFHLKLLPSHRTIISFPFPTSGDRSDVHNVHTARRDLLYPWQTPICQARNGDNATTKIVGLTKKITFYSSRPPIKTPVSSFP